MPAANISTVASRIYTTNQLFNRSTMGALWAVRQRLDPGQVKILDSLYKNKKKASINGSTTVVYKLSNTIVGRLGYGRYYSQCGLETLACEIRGSLAGEYYTDIDVVNAHPVLIPQVAKAWLDMDMPHTEAFNRDREAVLADIMETEGISRDDAKKHIFTVLYGGKLADNAPQIFREMYAEVRDFTIALIKSKKHDALYQHVKSLQKNTYGSFLSHILQTEERHCLEAMIEYLTNAGLQVDVLAYDGCMTRGKNNVTDEILRGCEEAIKDATGWTLTLKPKAFSVMEDLAEAMADDAKGKEAEYEEMKAEWEKTHFYFKPTGTIVEIKDGHLCHYKIDHATEAFNMWQLTGEDDKPAPFLKAWREDPKRRIVDTLVYKLPENCAANECSLFTGYAWQRIKDVAEDAEAIKSFNEILRAVSADNEQVFAYLLNTFAHMIQKPFEKTGVCNIFSSRSQGTGKDTIMGWVMKIMGNHIAHYTSDDIFWDKHDTRKEGAVMMYLEEAGMGNRAKENALKARITSDDLEVRPCGIPAYTVPNIARYFMTTNEVNPVKIDDTDRRFMIVSCSDRLRTQHAFWDKVHTNLSSNPAWIYTIGKMLSERDISAFLPRRMPVTAYKEALQEAAVDSEKAFLSQWDGAEVGGADLYNEYRAFCQQQSLPHALNLKSFGTKIIPFIGNLCSKKRVTSGVVYFKNDQQKAATVRAEAPVTQAPVGEIQMDAVPFTEEEVRAHVLRAKEHERRKKEKAEWEAKINAVPVNVIVHVSPFEDVVIPDEY